MTMICDICDCDNSEENPIIEILDEENCVEGRICMFCFVKMENDKDAEYTV